VVAAAFGVRYGTQEKTQKAKGRLTSAVTAFRSV
jgi:hypothetical protein